MRMYVHTAVFVKKKYHGQLWMFLSNIYKAKYLFLALSVRLWLPKNVSSRTEGTVKSRYARLYNLAHNWTEFTFLRWIPQTEF